tara:strand:- start:191 stop:1063 length:873 start_codon:yes stop_codon:yes gene_type:complete
MIPDINMTNPSIPIVGIGDGGVRDINVWTTNLRDINIPDARIWMEEPPEAVPIDVPVVVNIGKPIVDMPGCVTVHKENTGRDPSKNKMLVNDDPKGNTTLCDSGMPSYQPVDYQSQGLTWTTVVPEEPEPDGVNSEPPPPPDLDTPSPEIPPTGGVETEKECPGPGDLRVGDYATSGNEKVVGHEWNNDQTKCITLWEDVGFVEKYLPSPQVVTTTATIAVVATSSALLAKPLADLLLKVIKPLVKKISAKVKKVLGKSEKVLSVAERREEQRDRNQAIRTLRKALKSKK